MPRRLSAPTWRPSTRATPTALPGNLRELIRTSGPTFALPSDAPERVAA